MEVLYIEDNLDNRIVMEALLKRLLDVDIVTLQDAEQGLAYCQEKLPDIILMDIRLPGMSGVEAIRRLKADAKMRDIPVIAVSADAMDTSVDEAIAAGAERYITKPFDIDDITSAIKTAVKQRH